jgi:hypothetical protein
VAHMDHERAAADRGAVDPFRQWRYDPCYNPPLRRLGINAADCVNE